MHVHAYYDARASHLTMALYCGRVRQCDSATVRHCESAIAYEISDNHDKQGLLQRYGAGGHGCRAAGVTPLQCNDFLG